MSERIIKTGLGPRYKDMLDAVIGQMSDGYWENTPMMKGYWKFVTTGTSGNEVTLNVDEVSGTRDGDGRVYNRFYGMSDEAVKKFFADKIKFLIKEEGLGKWARDNESETDYLSYSNPYRVKDCYYAYEILKGRNARKHPEYGDVEESRHPVKIKMLEASSAIDFNSLGMKPEGNYEEWFDGWDVFPDSGSLKWAAKRGRNTIFARFYGATKETTITDGATIGYGGSEDPHNPNWITHTEEVAEDKSHIFEGDMVTFTVRRGAKKVKLRGKVIAKEYDGNWGWQHKNDGGHFGRPTCSLEIRLSPKAMADAIAKLEMDEGRS